MASCFSADTVVNSDIAATAKWRTITEAQDAIDYLFIGASTISTEFWYTYEATFGSLDAVNLAVPGYKISDWLERLTSSDVLKYNPTKIIMHIGLNDVNDAQHDAQTVIADLEKLFAGLQEIYPDANLYYVTIIKNVAFSQNTATYAAVNSWVDGLDDVELIDVGFDLMSSMTTGNVDATIGCLVNHEVPQMEEEGFEVNWFELDDYGVPTYYEGVFLASDDTIENDADMLRAFLRASAKGFEDVKADPAAALRTLLDNQNEENFPLSETVETESLNTLLPMMETSDAAFLSQSEACWQENIDWLLDQGLIDQAPAISDVMVDLLAE